LRPAVAVERRPRAEVLIQNEIGLVLIRVTEDHQHTTPAARHF
jgi:hypothetical protein